MRSRSRHALERRHDADKTLHCLRAAPRAVRFVPAERLCRVRYRTISHLARRGKTAGAAVAAAARSGLRSVTPTSAAALYTCRLGHWKLYWNDEHGRPVVSTKRSGPVRHDRNNVLGGWRQAILRVCDARTVHRLRYGLFVELGGDARGPTLHAVERVCARARHRAQRATAPWCPRGPRVDGDDVDPRTLPHV